MAIQGHAHRSALAPIPNESAGNPPERLVVADWLFFYELQASVPLTAYGKRLLQPERRTERIELTLAPGEAKETDLPVGVLYDLRPGGDYRLRVSCRISNETVIASNEIAIRT